MDFMNLNQSAHGDREFAFIQTRLRRGRKTIVGHWEDPRSSRAARVRGRGRRPAGTRRTGSGSPASATTCARSRSPRATRSRPRPGSASRSTATASPTSSRRVEAVADADVDAPRRRLRRPTTTSRRRCARAATGTPSCGRRPGSRPGLRSFLDDGGFGAFTDTFEDLGALAQLPGHRRPAADGRRLRLRRRGRLEGRRARADPEGHGRGPAGRHLVHGGLHLPPGRPGPRGPRRAHARGLPVDRRRAAVVRDPPAVDRRPSGPGPARVRRRARARRSSSAWPTSATASGCIANEVDVVEPDAPLPRLPVARAVWRPRPDLATAAEAWLTAGGPHHTALTTALGDRGAHRLRRDRRHRAASRSTPRRRPAAFRHELRWNQAYYFLEPRAVSVAVATARRRRRGPADAGAIGRASAARRAGRRDHAAASGPSGCARTASGRSRTASSSWSRPATSRTSGSPPGATGRYQALGIMFDGPFPFLDSDVYKWLEARRLGARAGAGRRHRGAWPTRRSTLVAAAQRDDGYLNTFVQVLAPGARVPRPAVGPRAVLHRPPRSRRRSPGTGRSATTGCSTSRRARRTHVDARARARRRATAIDGHPEIEMALVELYRIDRRARATSSSRARSHRPARPRAARVRTGSGGATGRTTRPVREARGGRGPRGAPAVPRRGAVDVAVETGDAALLDAVHRALAATWSRPGRT